MSDTYERVENAIENMDESDLVEIWNEYCDRRNYSDDHIFGMYEIDDYLSNMTPTEIIDKVVGSNFDTSDDWFKDGIYFESFSDVPSNIDEDDLINYIIIEDEDFGNSDIRDALDEDDEDNED